MTDPARSKEKVSYLEWKKRTDLHDEPWSLMLINPDGRSWPVLMGPRQIEIRGAAHEPAADERAAFEAWAKDRHWSVERSPYDRERYAVESTQTGWWAWRARAARSHATDYGVTPTLAAIRMAIHTYDNDRNERRVLEEIQETVRYALPDSKGDPDCVDQASAMAEAAIRELQARRAAPPPAVPEFELGCAMCVANMDLPGDDDWVCADCYRELVKELRAAQPPVPDLQMALTLISEVDCHLANAKWDKDATARRKLHQAYGLIAPASRQDQPPVPEWRPIETAPKDGSDLLLAKIVGHIDHPTAVWWMVKGSWSLKWNKWWDGIEPCGLSGPSHWMPIPRAIAPAKNRCGACSPAEFGGPLCACHTLTKESAREHIESKDCWCNPTLDYVDPDTGAAVYIHHKGN